MTFAGIVAGFAEKVHPVTDWESFLDALALALLTHQAVCSAFTAYCSTGCTTVPSACARTFSSWAK